MVMSPDSEFFNYLRSDGSSTGAAPAPVDEAAAAAAREANAAAIRAAEESAAETASEAEAVTEGMPEPVELPSEEGAAEVPTDPAGETDASTDAPVPADQAPAEEAAPAEDAPAEEAPAEDTTGN